MRRFFTLAAAALLAGGLYNASGALAADAPVAKATIAGAGDNKGKIHGTVTFTQDGDGVKVVANVDGLTPGQHGFHIHDKADLSAPDLTSAGGHWNPDNKPHGGPADHDHHAGDMGNITADEKGHGHLELMMSGVSVDGKNSVVGHSVIVHEKADDYKTQNPPGNAGKRIAGGVIEAEKK